MRLNNVLFKHHLDRLFKKHWAVQGKRVPIETGAVIALKEHNIEICEPQAILEEKKERLDIEVRGYAPESIVFDQTHPNWHDQPCRLFTNKNVLIEGLQQTQVLLKTISIDGIPESLNLSTKLTNNSEINMLAQQAIMSASLFDAEQVKLPKKKDPSRPAWNFPREYGISHARKMRLLTSKLLKICETFSTDTKNKIAIENAWFTSTFPKDNELIQLSVSADMFLVQPNNGIPAVLKTSTADMLLPNIQPLKSTISIPQTNIYEIQNNYPIPKINNFPSLFPHTIFIHHDKTEVANLHEEEVTETQLEGRSLLKSFAVAASYARQKYGDEINTLKEPVVLQTVNTDGKFVQFSVFQLNTLDVDGNDGDKNVWYRTKPMNLYENCCYKDGRPHLEGYNPEVIDNLLTFYNN